MAVSGKVICEETRDQRSEVVADALVSPDQKLAGSAGTLVLLIDAGCAGGPQ